MSNEETIRTRYSWSSAPEWYFVIVSAGALFIVRDQAGASYGAFTTYRDAALEARQLLGPEPMRKGSENV